MQTIGNERLRAIHPDFFTALDEGFGTHPDTCFHKLDIGRQGQLSAELTVSDRLHWVAWNGAGLQSLAPEQDRKIPLGKLLRRSGAPEDIHVLSYRPGRRLTILDRGTPKPRILKGFRKSHFNRSVEKYELAHTALSGRGVQTPEIVDVNRKYCCLVMVYEAGNPLQLSTESMDAFHLIGECLAGFQAVESPMALDEWHAEDELENLDRQSDRQTLLGLAPSNAWLELRERLGAVLQSLPQALTGLCHRDLHDKQFIQHSHYLTLLDFDLLCRANVAVDPANLLAHMRLRQLQGRLGATPVSTDVCGKRLLEGLARNGQAGFWEWLRFYQATTFARLALLYALRPAWADLTPDLITMGHRCLDDLRRVQMI